MVDETHLKLVTPAVESDGAPDPFDPANLRMPAGYDNTPVRPLLLYVPVRRKPKPQHFVRVRPDPEYRTDIAVIEVEGEDEPYLVTPTIAVQVKDECRFVSLFTGITRDLITFFWAIPLPAADGKDNEWNRSNREAANIAMHSWVRVTTKRELGAYVTNVAECKIPDPIWPKESLRDLLQIAFRERLIDRLDHPVLQKLRGRQV